MAKAAHAPWEKSSTMLGSSARDLLIMARALAYAIYTIKHLPIRWQEASDCEDMQYVLDRFPEPYKSLAIQSAARHIEGGKDDPEITKLSAQKPTT